MKLLLVAALVAALVTVSAHTLTGGMQWRGVSLAGAEYAVDAWGYGALPGVYGRNFVWPSQAYGYTGADYFIKKGMTMIRVPFRWERLQPVRGAAFNTDEFNRMRTSVRELSAKGVKVLLDMHNYMRYSVPGSSQSNDISIVGQGAVTIAHFADVWGRLAAEFKDDTNIIFALMNEPHHNDMNIYYNSIQAAINAIRATGATNLISVMGGDWAGVLWYAPQTNANTMLAKIKDPNGPILWEAHLYLDSTGSGSSADCVSVDIGVQRVASFTNWLVANKQIGLLSEFASGTSSTCLTAINKLLSHLELYQAYYAGWTYWDGGPGPLQVPNMNFNLEPDNGVDRATMVNLMPHITWQWDGVTAPVISTCTNQLYSQCGGQGFSGSTCCPAGTYCKNSNIYWKDCQLGTDPSAPAPTTVVVKAPAPAASSTPIVAVAPSSATPQVSVSACSNVALSKCGGTGFTGQTCCPTGYKCTFSNSYWSDCQKSTTTTTPSVTPSVTPVVPAPAKVVSTPVVTPPATTPVVSPPATPPAVSSTCPNKQYMQCGGKTFAGNTCCPVGTYCKNGSTYWWYCAKSTTTAAADEAALYEFDAAAPMALKHTTTRHVQGAHFGILSYDEYSGGDEYKAVGDATYTGYNHN